MVEINKGPGAPAGVLDTARIKEDFPILQRTVHGKPLVYLDNAATSQKPVAVIRALVDYYERYNANVHRGIHTLAEEATAAYEAARAKVAALIGASPDELVFTRGTTEALNMVAHGWARQHLRPGDEILVTPMEHHSNLVPWQRLAKERGLRLRAIPLTEDGRLDLTALDGLLTERTRLIAVTHMSNVLGTVTPLAEIARRARAAGAVVVADGAQSVPHLPVDVGALGVDFLAFSAHKMLGPTGVGALYARRERLEEMEPLLTGGGMIRRVTLEDATWADPPARFEAGTPDIAGVIAFGAAADYLRGIGLEAVAAHERELVRYAWERLREVPGLTVYGPGPEHRGGVISFTLEGVHAHDVAQVVDEEGVAIRAGHHCAQPLHAHLGVPATARASFYLYNDAGDVDRLVRALHEARKLFVRP